MAVLFVLGRHRSRHRSTGRGDAGHHGINRRGNREHAIVPSRWGRCGGALITAPSTLRVSDGGELAPRSSPEVGAPADFSSEARLLDPRRRGQRCAGPRARSYFSFRAFGPRSRSTSGVATGATTWRRSESTSPLAALRLRQDERRGFTELASGLGRGGAAVRFGAEVAAVVPACPSAR